MPVVVQFKTHAMGSGTGLILNGQLIFCMGLFPTNIVKNLGSYRFLVVTSKLRDCEASTPVLAE